MNFVWKRTENPVDFDAFIAFLDARGGEGPFELIEGEIVEMPGGTEDHEQIAMSIAVSLRSATAARGCRTYAGGMLVKRDDQFDMATAPDVVVRCGPPNGKRRFIDDPVVIAEVLSPSTLDDDRGPKMAFYKQIPSCRHIVLVYQDEWRVEAWDRAREGWAYRVLSTTDAVLELTAVAHAIPLTDIYAGTSLAAD